MLKLGHSAIGTLVERTTRFRMSLYLPALRQRSLPTAVHTGPPVGDDGGEQVRDALAAAIATLPEPFRRSPTWDQRAEMAQQAAPRVQAGIEVYLCEPRRPH